MDGTNIERNLYLTTQLIELGIPVVVAVNMIDLVRKNGDKIDLKRLGEALGCDVVEMSALKNEGGMEAAQRCVRAAQSAKGKAEEELPHVFTAAWSTPSPTSRSPSPGKVDARNLRWYAIKVFERDEKVLAELELDSSLKKHLEEHIQDCEKELDDDAESIITNQRYAYINKVVEKAVKKKAALHSLSTSDKIDNNRHQPHSGSAHLYRGHVCGVLGGHGALRHLPDRLDQRRVGRRLDDRGLPLAAYELGHCRLADGPGLRRHCGRCGRCAGLRAPDAGAVPDALHFGGHWLHGPCRLYHGPDFPQVRPFRQELYPHAYRFRLRGARRHGLPHH